MKFSLIVQHKGDLLIQMTA